ncbi:MAG: 23S rRNA (pseudouridine(1915)-N(3))-methyltransferase RlmH [Pseudomonadota bacterium]
MKIDILCAGHNPEPHEARWIAEYCARAKKYAPVSLTRIRERDPNRTWIEIEKKIPKAAFRIVLDDRGESLSTEEFARLLDRPARKGKKSLAFVIGGSYGLPDGARESADARVSLSPLTLPYRLALLVLCEQIYRVLSWRAGAPYHHE